MTESSPLNYESERDESILMIKISAVMAVIVILVPNIYIQLLLGMYLLFSVPKALFSGATAISMALNEKKSTVFQIIICLLWPILLSSLIIVDVEEISLNGLFGHMFSFWFLIQLYIVSAVSWSAVDMANKRYIFRAFVISSTIIFIINYYGHLGYVSEYDGYSEMFFDYISKDKADSNAITGKYFGQYLVYVLVSYVSMMLRLKKTKTLVVA